MSRLLPVWWVAALSAAAVAQTEDLAKAGFQRLWNGTDLRGWHGQQPDLSPYALAAMTPEARQKRRAEDDASVAQHWRVAGGELVNDGDGAYLTTDADFGDAEYRLEYRTVAKADSGIYLRNTPQVQIWDITEAGGKWRMGADKGSGGLWNNEKHERYPLVVADKPFGEWNTLRIRQLGELTWVWLNGQRTVVGTPMENYWNRKLPLIARGPLQLQTHGGEIRFREMWVKPIPPAEANAELAHLGGDDGYATVFDGKSLAGWRGDVDSYEVKDGAIRCRAGHGGNLFTAESYADFAVRLQFRLPKAGNNGLAIRYPGSGDAAFDAIEVQVLDDGDDVYKDLHDYQAHGSLYGLVAAHRGYLRPLGEWNFEEVVVQGPHYTVTLNGTVIVDADVSAITAPVDGRPHPGKDRTEGSFGFCGHNDPVEFRDVRIKRLVRKAQ